MMKFDFSSKYFCTVYKKVYYIVSSLLISLMIYMYAVHTIFNKQVDFLLYISIYFLFMYILYIVCKQLRVKNNTLSITKLTNGEKVCTVFIMSMYTMCLTMFIMFIHIISEIRVFI